MYTLLFVLAILFGGALSLGRTIDLSWNFDDQAVYMRGMRKFSFTKERETVSNRGYWYAAKEFCTAEHGGTHFDAPYHFNQKGWTVAEVPVARLFAEGALIDLKDEHKRLRRNTRLTVKHLEDWQKRNGDFKNGTVLLVQFGRSKYWQNRTKYLDLDSDNITMNFPGISEEAARWIVNSNKFYGVGLDTPSIDPGVSTDFVAHRILAESYLYNLENVKLLADLPDTGFELTVAPMKIEDGSGAPVRIFARLKENTL